MKYFFLLFLILNFSSYGQKYSLNENIKFSKYLLESKNYDDAIILLSQYTNNGENTSGNDSLNYFLGKAFYLNQQLDVASKHFTFVSSQSALFTESQFLNTICLSYSDNRDEAARLLNNLSLEDSVLKELQLFETSGFNLLKRDLKAFELNYSLLNDKYYHFTKPKQEYLELKSSIETFKPKSAFTAGAMSALVPGLGKVYTKKTGEGIATFFKLALLGLPALEALNKKGPEDPRFVVFASIFAIGYVANIWGSVVSVSVRRKEFNEKIDDQILVNMHIPVRSIFN